MTTPDHTETLARFNALDKEPELLPCPFCDGEAYIVQIGNEYTKSRGHESGCKKCNIKRNSRVIRMTLEWDKLQMIRHWNTRPANTLHAQLERQEKENAALREENKRVREALNVHPGVDGKYPLILYFDSRKEAIEFSELVQQVKPMETYTL